MSKKYQYVSRKRHSIYYYDARYPCNKTKHGHITCPVCIRRVGKTRNLQQEKQKNKN